MSGDAGGPMSHQKPGSRRFVGWGQHPAPMPIPPSTPAPDWVGSISQSVSRAAVRSGGEGLGTPDSIRYNAAFKKGWEFVVKNFEAGPPSLLVSLAQVYAQGYLAGRTDERTFGPPMSNVNEGHV